MSQLILAAVPIGNVGDASPRLRVAIETATHIAAEDSRKLARLCKDLGLTHKARVISFFDGNEDERINELIEILESGNDLLVVTDAGMPTVSDPGYRLARACLLRNISITSLPGPSAVVTALALSGLPTDRFCFEGFVPRTLGARSLFYESLAQETRTIIIFEAPHRISASLKAAGLVFGENRLIAVCREMTKVYEEVFRGTIKEAIIWSESKEILGELTIVIAGLDLKGIEYSDEEIVKEVLQLESEKIIRKVAIQEIAHRLGLSKRLVFDAMVRYKRGTE